MSLPDYLRCSVWYWLVGAKKIFSLIARVKAFFDKCFECCPAAGFRCSEYDLINIQPAHLSSAWQFCSLTCHDCLSCQINVVSCFQTNKNFLSVSVRDQQVCRNLVVDKKAVLLRMYQKTSPKKMYWDSIKRHQHWLEWLILWRKT